MILPVFLSFLAHHRLLQAAPAMAISVPVIVAMAWLLAGAPGVDAGTPRRCLRCLRKFAAMARMPAARRASMRFPGFGATAEADSALRRQHDEALQNIAFLRSEIERYKVLIVTKDELLARHKNARTAAEVDYETISRENAKLRARLNKAECGAAQMPPSWPPSRKPEPPPGATASDKFSRLKGFVLRELHPDTATAIDPAVASEIFKRLWPILQEIEKS